MSMAPMDQGNDLDPGCQAVSKMQTAALCVRSTPHLNVDYLGDYLSGPKGADNSAED